MELIEAYIPMCIPFFPEIALEKQCYSRKKILPSVGQMKCIHHRILRQVKYDITELLVCIFK